MSTLRLYTGSEKLTTGSRWLSEEESRHAQASRRLRAGDPVILFDGQGGEGQGEITAFEKRTVQIKIHAVVVREFDAPLKIVLAVALPKGPRQAVLVEKCTELGMAAIWPIWCQRSIAKPSVHGLHKLRRTAVEACKQSQRAWLPQIGQAVGLSEVLQQRPRFGTALLAHPEGLPLSQVSIDSTKPAIVLVGPEGDFTDEERALAVQAGFVNFKIGSTILRTETAAIAAIAQILLCMDVPIHER